MIYTNDGIGYLDKAEFNKVQEDLDAAERNLKAMDEKCEMKGCDAPGYVRTDDDGWLCQSHWSKFAND